MFPYSLSYFSIIYFLYSSSTLNNLCNRIAPMNYTVQHFTCMFLCLPHTQTIRTLSKDYILKPLRWHRKLEINLNFLLKYYYIRLYNMRLMIIAPETEVQSPFRSRSHKNQVTRQIGIEVTEHPALFCNITVLGFRRRRKNSLYNDCNCNCIVCVFHVAN